MSEEVDVTIRSQGEMSFWSFPTRYRSEVKEGVIRVGFVRQGFKVSLTRLVPVVRNSINYQREISLRDLVRHIDR